MTSTSRWRSVVGIAALTLGALILALFFAGLGTAGAMQVATGTPAATTVSTVSPGSPSGTNTVVPSTGVTSTATISITIPTIPAPVAVQLDPKTTALLILDVTNTICSRPSCVQTVQPDAALLKKARDAGVFVAYSDTGGNSTILPEVAPATGDPKVSGRADKFFGTNLDDLLKPKGIKTVVIVGYVANGAVLYSTFGANIRGYTAVVPVDGTGAEDPFIVRFTQYQLLSEPGFNNPTNQPLVEGRVTLSRSDLVTFVAGAAPPKPLATPAPATTAQPSGTTQPSATGQPTASSAPSATTAAPTKAPAGTGTPSAQTGQSAQSSVDALLPAGPGRDLLLANCSSCHSFACAIRGQRNEGQWATLKSGHRENLSNVSDADYDTLFTYLETNFNNTKPEPDLPPSLKGVSCTPY